MDNLNLWLWFCENKFLTRKVKYSLYSYFKTIENIYNAKRDDYEKLKFLSDIQIESLCSKSCDYEKLLSFCRKNNVRIITRDMDEYPKMLEPLKYPPLILYCRGNFIDLNKRFCISVVGTRNMSVYGKNCAYNISKELAQKGAVIVSGLADGVDSMAHSGALDAGMPTVAIIGCGVNVVYPKKNAALMKRILEHGMVISEYPLFTNPEKYHFPERNRIIAALSPATLVIEANIKSGSLITAKLSCDLGKDVYAVPGSIYSAYSKGTNYLIKDGAYPVSCADDVFAPYKETYAEYIRAGMNDKKEHIIENKMSPNEFISIKIVDEESYTDKDERKILSILSDTPVSMDFIYESLDMDISVLNTKLLMMELCGKIKKNPGNTYSKI